MKPDEVQRLWKLLNWKEVCRRAEVDYNNFLRWAKSDGDQGLKASEVAKIDGFLLTLGEELLNNA
jgi:hypothetical protein